MGLWLLKGGLVARLLVALICVKVLWRVLALLGWVIFPSRVLSRADKNVVILTNFTPEWLLIFLWLPVFWLHYLAAWWASLSEWVASIRYLGSAWAWCGVYLSEAGGAVRDAVEALVPGLPANAAAALQWVLRTPACYAALFGVFLIVRVILILKRAGGLPKRWWYYVLAVLVAGFVPWAVHAGLLDRPIEALTRLFSANPVLALAWVLFGIWSAMFCWSRLFRSYRLEENGQIAKLGPLPGLFARRLRAGEQPLVVKPRLRNPLRSLLCLGSIDLVPASGNGTVKGFEIRWAVGLWITLAIYDVKIGGAVIDPERNLQTAPKSA